MKSCLRLTILMAMNAGRCQKCGTRCKRYPPHRIGFIDNRATVEHVIPKCLGGTNDLSNLTLFCQLCNHKGGVALSKYLATRPRST